ADGLCGLPYALTREVMGSIPAWPEEKVEYDAIQKTDGLLKPGDKEVIKGLNVGLDAKEVIKFIEGSKWKIPFSYHLMYTQILGFRSTPMTSSLAFTYILNEAETTHTHKDSEQPAAEGSDEVSEIQDLIKQHNERSKTLIEPIILTFGDEGKDDKGKDDDGKTEEGKKDLQKPHTEVLRSLFTRRIIEFLALKHYMPANLRIYDGSIDLDDHISHFVGAVN
ncbi:hypothetical protein Tco_0849220, partial [Tanacetum coccineum]